MGSFPRPPWLLESIERYEKGELSSEELESSYDDAVKVVVKEQEMAGVDVVADGEQRRFSFLAFVAERLPCFKMVPVKQFANAEAQEIASQMNLHVDLIQNPVIVDEVVRTKPIALHELESARRFTRNPIKVPLIGPYTLLINSWNKQLSSHVYPEPEDAMDDIARMLREEIIALRDAGAAFVQLDEPGIGNFVDYRYTRFLLAINGWRPADLKELHRFAVDAINTTLKGITGIKTGVHICRGNWRASDERFYSWGGYDRVLPELLDVRAQQLVLELATQRAGTVDVFKPYNPSHELGLGVIDVKSSRVETPGEIVARVEAATKVFDAGKIWLNPDCGFASGRPWPVVDRATAMRKLEAQSRAAEMLREKFGS